MPQQRACNTEGLPGAAVAPCPARARRAFALLRRLCSPGRSAGITMAALGPPTIRSKVREATGRDACVQWSAGLRRACAQAIRAALARVLLAGLPPPPLRAFAPHPTPPLRPLGLLHGPPAAVPWWRNPRGEQPGRHRRAGGRFLLAPGEDRGRPAPHDSDARRWHRGSTPFFLILEEAKRAWTGTSGPARARRPRGVLPAWHHLAPLALGPRHLHKSQRPFPASLSNGGVCARRISEEQLH
jgi:hypothetical protein